MSWRAVKWHHVVGLSIILLLAAVLRFYDLSQNALWTDEYLSLECSSGWGRYDLTMTGMATPVPNFITLQNAKPLKSIWSSMARDENHPPLYFVFLRIWRNLFGDSPRAIRSLSVVSAVIAMTLLFAICVVKHSPQVGLWASLLMAAAIPQIQQSQDARAYMPVTAACLAAALALVLIERNGISLARCTSLVVCTLAAGLMHYMAFATIGAMFIYSACVMNGKKRLFTLGSIVVMLCTYAAVWGPQLVGQHFLMAQATGWLVVDGPHHIRETMKCLSAVPARLFLDLDLDSENLPVAGFGAGALIIPLMLCRRYPRLLLWCIWLMVPISTVFLIDIVSNRCSLSLIKYTLLAGPALYIMLGMLATEVRRVGWLPAAVIAFSCFICLPGSYRSQLPDWREVSKAVLQKTKPGDPIIVVDAHPNDYANDNLLSLSYYLARQNRPLFLADRVPAGAVSRTLATARHACIIADNLKSLNWQVIPGLSLNRSEFLAGMAIVGTIDPMVTKVNLAKAKALNSGIAAHAG